MGQRIDAMRFFSFLGLTSWIRATIVYLSNMYVMYDKYKIHRRTQEVIERKAWLLQWKF